MNNEKVINFEKLDKVSLKYKNLSLKIILCHGMFDLLHLGHIRYFNEAKKQGDILIVTLTADEYSRKGPGKPVFNEELRAESLAALEVIDYVSVCPYPTAIEAIQKVQPHIYAKGKEYEIESEDVTGMITKEREAVESYGGNIYFTDDLVFSSSSIINNEFDIFSSDVKEYLQYLKNNYDIKCIIGEMNALKSLKVLVIGEAIIDRYTYVDPLGQSGKGIHLAVRNICSEEYAGGAIAVANHVSGFVDEVALFTGLGENSEGETYESFIKEELNENVSPDIFYFNDAQTIVKERFVSKELNKFFEVYFAEEEPQPSLDEEKRVCEWLEKNVPKYDVVIVADYGNGFITNKMTKVISAKSKFLAVNAQINSGNRGYHVVSRYDCANFISLNEPELRLTTHNRHDSIELLTRQLAAQLNAGFVSITQGPKGLLTYVASEDDELRVPALSSKVVDRVGAGDAFLSLSAICLGGKIDPRIAIFSGAAAAAIDVQIVGNKTTINRIDLEKYLTALLK